MYGTCGETTYVGLYCYITKLIPEVGNRIYFLFSLDQVFVPSSFRGVVSSLWQFLVLMVQAILGYYCYLLSGSVSVCLSLLLPC